MKELEDHLLLVFTGIKRRAMEVEKQKLGSMAGNSANLASLHRMVEQGHTRLAGGGSLEPFGRLLDEGWRLKRGLCAGVTNDEIEMMYATGLANGAWGGKLLGAGGGGFLLFCAPPERHAAIAEALPGKHRVKVSLASPGSAVVFSEPQSV